MRLILTLVVLTLAACSAPEMPLPGITGKAGELVVVMDEEKWKGQAGDTAFNMLSQPIYGLPQAEPTFNVVHIKPEAFTKIFQTHRNIVVVHFGEEAKPRVDLRNDVWASPQIVIEMWAPNEETFIELFSKNVDRIIAHIIKKEEERTLKSYNAQRNDEVINELKNALFVNMSIPKGYNIARQETDFMWIRYETKDLTQSILVYSEPYQRQNTFTEEGMVEVMDKFCKLYIPGPDDGSYMATYTEYPPQFTETALGKEYATEMKGLWHVEHALMGGPFVTYATLDKARNRVVYLHGFVFSPGKNKRNYMRQLETILHSAEIIE